MPRIHILGASGSGTSTLEAALKARLGLLHVDTDDYFWLPSDPPYILKRDTTELNELLLRVLAPAPHWVLTGSISGWEAPECEALIEGAVWLLTPHAPRMARLRARELERYGAVIAPGGAQHREYVEFIEWAALYDTAGLEQRSRATHEQWLRQLGRPVLAIEDDSSVVERVARVVAWLACGNAKGSYSHDP